METIDAIHGRRTIHKYEDSEVPNEVIEQCIRAAHQAPNHKLTWPWGFVNVGPQTRHALFEMALAMRAESRGLTPKAEDFIRTKFLNPGGLVVVTQVLCDDAFTEREDYAATSCAIQNFMLAAYDLGYGTKWSTGSVTRLPQSYEIFQVDSTKAKIVGIIWMGDAEEVPVVERPDLTAVMTQLP